MIIRNFNFVDQAVMFGYLIYSSYVLEVSKTTKLVLNFHDYLTTPSNLTIIMNYYTCCCRYFINPLYCNYCFNF